MIMFIFKSLIVTACAIGGYWLAMKISVDYAIKVLTEYVHMLNGDEESE